jgi:hypothetical protein
MAPFLHELTRVARWQRGKIPAGASRPPANPGRGPG